MFHAEKQFHCSGPLLGNEIAAIKRRLNRSAEDLRDLRSHRLHLSSAEFYATLETPNTLLAKHDGNAERTDGFSTLRKLIERIGITINNDLLIVYIVYHKTLNILKWWRSCYFRLRSRGSR